MLYYCNNKNTIFTIFLIKKIHTLPIDMSAKLRKANYKNGSCPCKKYILKSAYVEKRKRCIIQKPKCSNS